MIRDLDVAAPPVVVPDNGYRSWKKKSKEKNRLLFTRMGRSDHSVEPSTNLRQLLRDYNNMMRLQTL